MSQEPNATPVYAAVVIFLLASAYFIIHITP